MGKLKTKFQTMITTIKWSMVLVFTFIHPALAHVSEQGIMLLLPTDFYIISGCLAVILSMVLVTLISHRSIFKFFKPYSLFSNQLIFSPNFARARDATSIMSLGIIIFLVIIGAIGSRDPLVNMLPLMIWTFWWIAIFMLHAFIGNLWTWINPWSGFYNLFLRGSQSQFILPKQIGSWPAIILFVAFYIFIIADVAPDDPARLSNIVLGYIIFTFMGMILFGSEAWLNQVECFTLLFKLVSHLAPFNYDNKTGKWSIGLPGWKCFSRPILSVSQAFFVLSMLASGSFDGVNETFWWLVKIGVNPLEFPGRSAVILPSTFGMLAANGVLYALFATCIWIGMKLVVRQAHSSCDDNAKKPKYMHLFTTVAFSLLPITIVYHGSHYLTSFMVNGQYLIAAISDPLANGSNYLALTDYQVTTGYLNQLSSIEKIWLTQAGMVVVGHIIAVLMAHFAIAKHFNRRKDATLFHIPIAIFMAAYTWFGLWLLAAPKGA